MYMGKYLKFLYIRKYDNSFITTTTTGIIIIIIMLNVWFYYIIWNGFSQNDEYLISFPLFLSGIYLTGVEQTLKFLLIRTIWKSLYIYNYFIGKMKSQFMVTNIFCFILIFSDWHTWFIILTLFWRIWVFLYLVNLWSCSISCYEYLISLYEENYGPK